MLIQKVSADRLNPAAYNPRRDLKPGDKDYEKLKRSIEEFGFVEPVVWNRRTGFVDGRPSAAESAAGYGRNRD